jgi:thioester reductase-like protein
MIEFVLRHQVSNCIITPTQLKLLFRAENHPALKEWKCLRSMTLVGEPMPSWLLTNFLALDLPHAVLYNGYAPTETTIINALRPLKAEDAKGEFLPLCSPFPPTSFYILDPQGRPTPTGVPGELYIGGETVNDGYIKRPDLTPTVFLRTDSFSPEGQTVRPVSNYVYRTGDSFFVDFDGTVRCIGRIAGNRQVKIRGMRVELDEIETILYDTMRQLDGLLAMTFGLVGVVFVPAEDGRDKLVAYLEQLEGDDDVQPEVEKFLKGKLRAVLPIHMVPGFIRFVPELPRTATSKLDYKALLSWKITDSEDHTPKESVELRTQEEKDIAQIWADVLGSDRPLGRDTDFFSAGGSSILLLRVGTAIQAKFGIEISLADLFASPEIWAMASLLSPAADLSDKMHSPKADSGIGSDSDEHGRTETRGASGRMIDWEEEIALPLPPARQALSHPANTAKVSSDTRSSAVALTGAAGMIGVHFLAHLLLETSHEVHCLACPGDDAKESKAGILSALATWRLDRDLTSKHLDRIIAYSGSLGDSDLGLKSSEIDALDATITEIWHLASDVSLIKGYDLLKPTNVGSLAFLIGMARGDNGGPVKKLHYLSTWAVPHLQIWSDSERSTDSVVTAPVTMSHFRPGRRQNLGYLKVRWVAEQLLAAAAAEGVPVSIFRAPMCAPDKSRGCALDQTDINRRILAGSLLLGKMPDFGSDEGGGMSWIDTSYLAPAMCALAERAGSEHGKPSIHHITTDQHTSYAALAEMLGPDVQLVEPAEWFAALRATGDPEMNLQAGVLQEMWNAGWRPFAVDGPPDFSASSSDVPSPPHVDAAFLRQVVGDVVF